MKNTELFADHLQTAQRHLARRDSVMRQIIKTHGACRIKPHTRYFETLIGSIISQQLSTKAAKTIQERFLALYAPKRCPLPAQILETPEEIMRGVGLSMQKLRYIKDLAAKTHQQEVKLARIARMSDEEVIAALTQIKGIGVWTVQMFLIFSLGRLNVLPVGDLGVRNAIQRAYGFAAPPTRQEMETVAEQNGWHPYCSVASWYLWRSLENKPM